VLVPNIVGKPNCAGSSGVGGRHVENAVMRRRHAQFDELFVQYLGQ
jgi:hypothetical protein